MLFTDLLSLHHNENKNFDVEDELIKCYLKYDPDDNWQDVQLDEINICDILPETKLIANTEDFNICYHGRDCTAYQKTLYKYREYFIIYEYRTENSDLEVLSIGSFCFGDDIVNFNNMIAKVFHKNEFNNDLFLQNIKNVNTIATFFINMFTTSAVDELKKYTEKIYIENLSNEQKAQIYVLPYIDIFLLPDLSNIVCNYF